MRGFDPPPSAALPSLLRAPPTLRRRGPGLSTPAIASGEEEEEEEEEEDVFCFARRLTDFDATCRSSASRHACVAARRTPRVTGSISSPPCPFLRCDSACASDAVGNHNVSWLKQRSMSGSKFAFVVENAI